MQLRDFNLRIRLLILIVFKVLLNTQFFLSDDGITAIIDYIRLTYMQKRCGDDYGMEYSQ